MKVTNILSCGLLCIVMIACDSLIDIGTPKSEIAKPDAFADDLTAESTIRGIYSEMLNPYTSFTAGDLGSVSFSCGLSADELIGYYSGLDEFYRNSLNSSDYTVKGLLWESPYKFIYYANSLLEGLENSSGVTLAMQKQLAGEAKFIRAFCYFYLVNLFGDVPLVLTTDYKINQTSFRIPKNEVYQLIIADLEAAQNALASDYSFSMGERVRPNKWAATALLARVYLYIEDWANAEAQATMVISNTADFALCDDLNNVFLKNSTETIWQLMQVYEGFPGLNTWEGLNFIFAGQPPSVSLSDQVVNAFEENDDRKISWVGKTTDDSITWYYYPYKYKVQIGFESDLKEYSMVLRLAEQYLIRAEARTRQSDITGAQEDLNIIRERAGLPNTTAGTQASLLLAVEQERRVELFTEWGHRWLDLKRTNRVDAVLAPLKSTYWQSSDALYPIPQSEIEANRNLKQNPDY